MAPPRTTTIILAAAAVVGLIADQLFRGPVWGINVPIAAALLAAAGLAVPSEDRTVVPWGWAASVFFASMWAVRDAESLLAVDLLAALALAGLPLLRERRIQLTAVDLIDLVLVPLRTTWAVTIGTFGLAPQIARALPPPADGRTRAMAIGVLLAVPPVLIFGGLFASADPVFDAVSGALFDTALGPLVEHAITAGILAWASAGYLWFLAKPARDAKPAITIPSIGGLQVLTPLFATVVVFGLFVGMQAPSLFGGAGFVETTTGLTFAEYARGGFFQLVVASALVLPMVYFAPAIAGPLDEAGTRRLRSLLGAQLALTGLVLASALWRMGLYIGVYGLTEDRVNGTAIMAWIAGTLGVFALTVARGRPKRAAFGSLVSAVAALAALNLANPEALIARHNLFNQTGREVDFEHLARLGGDAIPILVSEIGRVPEESRCQMIGDLRRRQVGAEGDWRGWNVARARARRALAALDLPAACPPPARP